MIRSLPTATGGIILLLGGLLHGVWTDRWTIHMERAAAAGRLGNLPRSIPDWEGEELEISPRELALSGSIACLSRRYANRRSGDSLTVIVLCGRPGPVSVHTPDVCYRGLGYEPVGVPIRWSTASGGGSPSASFWTAVFRKETPAEVSHLRIFWAWSTRGGWEAYDLPRLTMAREPVLYKLYVIRNMADEGESLEDDPAVEFLKDFLPQLRHVLANES